MPLTDDPWLPYDGDGVVPGSRHATPIATYRSDGGTLAPLPNVHCLAIDRKEGTDPGRASFRYNFDSGLEGAPTTFDEAMSSEFSGDYVVEPGDRLVVLATPPEGADVAIFDGFALSFGLTVGPNSEGGHFDAVGVAVRCWDEPVPPAYVRDASAPTNGEANVQTDRPAHFNPQGRPNATADANDAVDEVGGALFTYPVFIDPTVIRDPEVRRAWTAPMACRYVLRRCNPTEEFVLNPDLEALDDLLVARVPTGSDYDPSDPGTYDVKDFVVPDLPITGKSWPNLLHDLVRRWGFGMDFRLDPEDDPPTTKLGFFRPQDGPVKDLYLAARGTPFDPTLFNVQGAGLDRDLTDVANEWAVRGAPIRREVSFILRPGYPSSAADGASPSTLRTFDRTDPDYVANRDKYRVFVFDEAGDGHYAPGSTTKVTAPPSLDALFGADTYSRSPRKPIGTLFSRDAGGKLLPATLSISTDYAGTSPGLWDGTGTWQRVADSAWSLLPDRIGIRVDAASPNKWKVNDSKATGAPYPSGVVRVVESMCGMSGAVPFFLRLTCVVESDECCGHTAERRDESPIPWPIRRVIDAADRVKKQLIDRRSEFNDTAAAFADRIEQVDRDDTEVARAEAVAAQLATQSGVMGGGVSIPRFTAYYAVGDRIGSIEGRGLGLRTDGDATGTNLVYPTVVGVRWQFDGEQRTTLTLSDAGTNRSAFRRAASRR